MHHPHPIPLLLSLLLLVAPASAACPELSLEGALPLAHTSSTAGRPNDLASSCGGEDGVDIAFEFTAPREGVYRIDKNGSDGHYLYVRDGTCGGAELACSFGSVEVMLGDGQTIVIVVDRLTDGAGGPFTFEVRWLCEGTPSAGCRSTTMGGKAALKMTDALGIRKDKLQWKWEPGAATAIPDFGTPTSTEDYALCMYDGGVFASANLVRAGQICGSKPCWKATPTGFQYSDKHYGQDGIKKIKLKSGDDGRARVLVEGSSFGLLLPSLPMTGPVTVRLQRGSGAICWDAVYDAPFTINDGTKFSDKTTP